MRLCHAPHSADIAGVEVRGKAERRVVAHRDIVGFVLEANHRRERAEGLIMRNECVRSDFGENGRFEEAATERVSLAAGDDLGTSPHGVCDVALDLVDRFHVG
jgi:hypothetical protein